MAKPQKPDEQSRLKAEEEIDRAARQVRFSISEYTVEVLANKVRDDEIYVPDYQRKFTWRDDRKSRFIESILIGLPIPFVFFWQADDGRLEIVDGSQRLRTIREFIDDEFVLVGLELIPGLNGFCFSGLEKSRKRNFSTVQLEA